MRHTLHSLFVIVILVFSIGLVGCGRDLPPLANETPSLKQSLSKIKGTYTWRDDLNRYVYSEKLRLEEILAAQRRPGVVSDLVDCLDDQSPSLSLIGGKSVPIGYVCYEALTQLVYYEPITPDGDVADNWPGYISLSASPQEMRVAKEAWQKVVKSKSFIYQ